MQVSCAQLPDGRLRPSLLLDGDYWGKGCMAWISALFGAVGGLVLAVAASMIGGWPVWLVLLLYPVAAVVLMLGMLAFQLWRSGSGEHSAGARRGSGPKAGCSPGLDPL